MVKENRELTVSKPRSKFEPKIWDDNYRRRDRRLRRSREANATNNLLVEKLLDFITISVIKND
jgi:hypothetical protein